MSAVISGITAELQSSNSCTADSPVWPAAAGSGAEAGSAEEWRERGNARFKAGDYAGAREAYTASLAVSPTCLAHANRAMAALKVLKLPHLMRNVDTCLTLWVFNPTHSRQRDGVALPPWIAPHACMMSMSDADEPAVADGRRGVS